MRDRVQPGTIIEGTYRITRRIGEGGMGTVYEASHARLDGRYAVKFLHPDISSRHPGAVARFRREARITSALRHPGIVQVIDFNMPTDGPPFLVMELLDGSNLAEVIAREAPFPLTRVDDITSQVASALSAAHHKGIVHRDLNPSNIFVVPGDGDQPERVKILDFGISKIRSVSKRITGTAQLLGTPQYMAPEQAQGGVKEMDAAADQFSLASIVYEMLTGRPAFTGDTLAAVAYQVVHATPEPISELRGALPPDVETVLAKALAKDKRDRFESISAFAGAFRRAAQPHAAGGFPDRRPRPPEGASKWSEAETVVSPPGFLEKLALQRSPGPPPARPPTGHQKTVDIRRRRRIPIIGFGWHTGEIPPLRPAVGTRTSKRAVVTAAAAASVGIVALLLGLLTARSHRDRPAPQPLVRALDRPSPMVQPLRSPAPAPAPANPNPNPNAAAVAAPIADAARGADTKARVSPTTRLHARPTSVDTKPLQAPNLETERLESELGLAAASRSEALPAERCSFTLGSSPWAALWIDGQDTGKHTPVVQLAVDCGKHTVELKRADLRLQRLAKVVLRPGEELRARYRLEPSD